MKLFSEVQLNTGIDFAQEEMLMPGRDCTFRGPEGDFHYIDWGGTGPPAHFSHATGLCAGVYSPLTNLLGSQLGIIGLDDRGHGKTAVPADPTRLKSWDVFADDLAIFFESLSEPVIAIGHSRGATASLLLAVKRPELVRALVLIDPTILPLSWMWWWYLAKKTGAAKRVPIAATAARRRYVWPDRRSMLDSYREKAVFSRWQKEFLRAYIETGTEVTADGNIRLCCAPAWESRCFAVCPHDVWRYIPRLKQPTLVLYGAKSDTFRAPAARRFKAKVPAAVMVSLEETGHFVPMERPAETAETIITFLKTQGIV
jgi:pimeloyl-ACP methyl ester carboxylesterase